MRLRDIWIIAILLLSAYYMTIPDNEDRIKCYSKGGEYINSDCYDIKRIGE